MEKKKTITIDGPAGAGKSTVSRILADKLNYIYLDTGALYRALAYKAIVSKTPLTDEKALAILCSSTEISLKNVYGKMRVYIDGEDVGEKIRNEEVGLAASTISAFPVVRESLLNLQRQVGANGGIVAEGRDMGSIVFPNADFKFFLSADLEERTRRREKELIIKKIPIEYAAVKKDILARDQQDSQRKIAPLKATEDAILIDSTSMNIPEVVEKIIVQISVKRR